MSENTAIQEDGVSPATAPEEFAAVESQEEQTAAVASEQSTGTEHNHKLKKALGKVVVTLGVGVAGGGIGLWGALQTDAHTEIGGTPATIQLSGNGRNELDISQGTAKLKQHSDSTFLGQPVGKHLGLQVDTEKIVRRENGKLRFDTELLSAYFSQFSDTAQVEKDLTWALVKHLLLGGIWGAGLAEVAYAFNSFYKRKYPNPEGSKFLRRVAFGVATTSMLAAIPSAQMHTHEEPPLQFDPILAGTPFEHVEVSGTIKPFLQILENYYETYVTNTNRYYDTLQKRLAEFVRDNPVPIPAGDDIVNVGYVTDRHCNIGMDRVTVGLMNAYGVKTLVSGGDDAFSGSFSFESNCTANLADRSKKSGITDIMVGGNHDSAMTLKYEREQGMWVLDDKPRTIDGLTFIGSSDPRGSRYGQGITIDGKPVSEAEQTAATTAQGKKLGELACKLNKKVIAVAHDPNAGEVALENGCGMVTSSLDGHTHTELRTGQQFTGASGGGAPNKQTSRDLLEHVTVGPLNSPATVYMMSYNKTTGMLLARTAYTFSPDMTISAETKKLPQADATDNTSTATGYRLPNSDDVLKYSAAR